MTRGREVVTHLAHNQKITGANPVCATNIYPCVAQSGSASGLGPEGRRFDSCHTDQLGVVNMEKFNQFLDKNYYEVYDDLQDVAVEKGMHTCLIEDDLDYNIDYDSLRIKIFTNSYNIIVKIKKG